MMSVQEVQIVQVGTIRIEVDVVWWWGGRKPELVVFTGFATQEYPQPKILCLSPCLSH